MKKNKTITDDLSSSIKNLAMAYVGFESAKTLVTTLIDLENGMVGVAKATGLTGANLQEGLKIKVVFNY